MKKYILYSLLTIPLLAKSQLTWQSAIVNFNSNGQLNYIADSAKNRVIDFSYAGYQNSNQPIPIITNVLATILPSVGDKTAEINAAIQAAALVKPNANGSRGVIQLAAGTYEIQGTIVLNVSGIVLRGAGSDTNGTVFTATGDVPHQRTVLLAGGGTNADWVKLGAKTNITTPFVQVGAMSFEVSNPSGFAVGNPIIVYHPSSKKWITAVDSGGVAGASPWTSGSVDIEMNRMITAINGKTITVESPITNHLNLALAQSYIYKIDKTSTKSQIGIENLRIDIQNWTNEVLDENHAWQGIEMYDIEDSWVKNVVALHFGQSGFKSGTAARLTFDSCQALVPVAILTGSQRDNFQVDKYSSNILFTHCYATKARHAFEVSGTSSATGVVFHRCTSVDATNPSEGHFHWPTAILYDCLRDTGNQTDVVLGIYNRGSFGTNHGWAAAHSVAWNCDLRRNKTPYGVVICQQPPTAQNFLIGGYGQVNVPKNIPFPQYPLGYVEGFNNKAQLVPTSLFEQQLLERLQTVLPIQFVTLKAQLIGNSVSLLVVSNTNDSAILMVEKSTDAVNFSTIQQTSMAALKLQLEDKFPLEGINYYRIKIQYLNGKICYSNVQQIKVANPVLTILTPFVRESITIKTNQATSVVFFNVNGQPVLTTKIAGVQTINIAKFPSGIYFIQAATGKNVRFIKQ